MYQEYKIRCTAAACREPVHHPPGLASTASSNPPCQWSSAILEWLWQSRLSTALRKSMILAPHQTKLLY